MQTDTEISFDGRARVEGFAAAVERPGLSAPSWRLSAGIGRRAAQLSPDWWREPGVGGAPVAWRTEPIREAADSCVVFAAETSNLTENAFPPRTAALSVDGREVLVFELGMRAPRTWRGGRWALRFTPQRVTGEALGYQRQLEAAGCAGVYELAAPASALEVGRPLLLEVRILPGEGRPDVWFALLGGVDAAAPSPQARIAELQEEVARLGRIVGNLARRSHSDLLPERLPTEDVVIYANGWRHVHQTDVVALSDDELLVTCREGSEHISNDGIIVDARSLDRGRTWSGPEIVRSHPRTDERESSLALLSDGTLLMNEWVNEFYDADGRYYGGVRASGEGPGTPSAPGGGRRGGIYVGRSTDGGRTWTWPETPIDPSPFAFLGTSERIVELPGGRLLMMCYFRAERRRYGAVLYGSDDRGHTWSHQATIADLPDVSLTEPSLLRLRSGRLITVIRNESGPGTTYYQSVSDDGGESWTAPAPTNIPGYRNPVSLVQLEDSRLLCIHGAREDPAGMYVVASEDDGDTWDVAHRRVLRDDLTNFDLGYPSSILLPDSRVFATYYLNLFQRYYIAGSFFRFD